jgi:hypothetical protein
MKMARQFHREGQWSGMTVRPAAMMTMVMTVMPPGLFHLFLLTAEFPVAPVQLSGGGISVVSHFMTVTAV